MSYARLALAVVVAGISLPLFAQDPGRAQVSPANAHDSLPSLRDVVPKAEGYRRWHERDEHMVPLPFFPPDQRDGAVQSSARRAAQAPTLQGGVDGVGTGFSGPQGAFELHFAPPDTVGAVGDTQYVQVVNDGFAIFDKTTKAVVYGPAPTNTLWTGFGGQCEDDNDGDAVVVYDKAANRWVMSQFAVGATPYLECVAVSKTSDATGGWWRYSFSYGSVFPDYPKMGVWPDAYYVTFNMFTGNSFSGSKLCAYDRSQMLGGAAATQQCVQLSSSFGGVLPSDLDGATPPPAGAPNYMLNFGSNSLNLWKFHVDWATPANTSLSGPTNLSVEAFTPACDGGACVPQSGTNQKLDSLADRMMNRLAYRNFGDHESLVDSQSVTVGTTKKNPYTGVRWYEIRSPATSPTVFQQSTFSPDESYRWMPSIAMDGDGNVALGYSVSSGSMSPAIRYTGRLRDDPANTLQAEASIIEGGGSQTTGLDRWGDYSAMTIDPVDDCTFWYTTEYLKANGTFNWSTRIASIRFPTCGVPKQEQTIEFTSTAPGAAKFGGSYIVTATATSGLAVTLTIDATSSGVCSLGGSASGSTVSFTGVGTCTINANQAGNGSYDPAPQVQQSFAIDKATQVISFDSNAPSGARLGDAAYTVLASSTSALAVVLTIDASASGVCELDGDASGSHVSFIGTGTCTIDANQPGNDNYEAATQQQQAFEIAAGEPTLEFTVQPVDTAAGSALATIEVTEKDALGAVIDDNDSSVDFSIEACGGSVSLGTAPMVHGVATLDSTLRLYTPTAPDALIVTASTATLQGTSAAFAVQGNAGLAFADGFEGCRP
jgi:hypothetical protein